MEKQCKVEGATVTFEDVTVAFGDNLILENISATIPNGSCTAVVGPNGAGKSTMLLALLGEVSYTGKIGIFPKNTASALHIGYVPQRLQFDRGIPLTVIEFMVMGRQRMPLWFGVSKRYRDRARSLLASVRMEKLADRKLGALSGGELQRVLLALALDQEPDLLVLDEPAAGVDFQGEHLFCELLDNLRCERGFTQLMVSHDLSTVTHHATHVICLNRRVAAEGAPRDTLTPENLAKIFGLHLGLVDNRALPTGQANCTSPCCAGEQPYA